MFVPSLSRQKLKIFRIKQHRQKAFPRTTGEGNLPADLLYINVSIIYAKETPFCLRVLFPYICLVPSLSWQTKYRFHDQRMAPQKTVRVVVLVFARAAGGSRRGRLLASAALGPRRGARSQRRRGGSQIRPEEKRSFAGAFPMFIPSLSW
jgi:hypothetical protein